MLQKTFPAVSLTPTEQLTSLQKRLEELQQKKIGAQKELELLQEQYQGCVGELKQYGIEDLANAPVKIQELEEELLRLVQQLENDLDKVEQLLRNGTAKC